jgi:hypothetical protein
MFSLSKLVGVLFVLSLWVLPLTGCDNPPWESGMALTLKIETPRDGTTVSTPTVTVSGRVNGTQSAAAKVRINGTDVPVKDGRFSTSVTLMEGTNVVNVITEGGGANLNKNVTVTYVPAK